MRRKTTPAAPLPLTRAELADLDRQWTAIKAGEHAIPHDQVVRWLETWGTPAFLPWKSYHENR
jgi:hypothetical protein